MLIQQEKSACLIIQNIPILSSSPTYFVIKHITRLTLHLCKCKHTPEPHDPAQRMSHSLTSQPGVCVPVCISTECVVLCHTLCFTTRQHSRRVAAILCAQLQPHLQTIQDASSSALAAEHKPEHIRAVCVCWHDWPPAWQRQSAAALSPHKQGHTCDAPCNRDNLRGSGAQDTNNNLQRHKDTRYTSPMHTTSNPWQHCCTHDTGDLCVSRRTPHTWSGCDQANISPESKHNIMAVTPQLQGCPC